MHYIWLVFLLYSYVFHKVLEQGYIVMLQSIYQYFQIITIYVINCNSVLAAHEVTFIENWMPPDKTPLDKTTSDKTTPPEPPRQNPPGQNPPAKQILIVYWIIIVIITGLVLQTFQMMLLSGNGPLILYVNLSIDNSLLNITAVMKWIIVNMHTLYTKFNNMFWYSTLCKETNHGGETTLSHYSLHSWQLCLTLSYRK